MQGIYTAGFHIYWKEGLHFDSWKKNLSFVINGRLAVDGGYIGTDEELNSAFPELKGGHADLRALSVTATGKLRDVADFKVEVDFSHTRQLKDIWIAYRKVPLIGHVALGNMKEPFSLEYLTSGKHTTFMERALPALAFAPGRNIGLSLRDTAFDERLTWAVGGFWVTGSYSDVAEARDQLSESFGASLTGRITYLPRYADGGKRLWHVGLSYTHQWRDESREGSNLKLSALPESYLTSERLVSTGKFPTSGYDLFSLESAVVSGRLSFQGEYFQSFVHADAVGNPRFLGFYVFASYFLTGEHRRYDRRAGVFTGVKPTRDFRPLKGAWGAWELAFRISYTDLSDGGIEGGKEFNSTAGLNGYLSPNVKFMVNYIRARVKDRSDPLVDTGRANMIQSRFQVLF